MVDKGSVDEYLGFAHKAAEHETQEQPTPAPETSVHDGAYEDSWYQVLKAQAEEADGA
jgi:hypothetical protein